MTTYKKRGKRPVVMDRSKHFLSCMDAARHLKKITGVVTTPEHIASNIFYALSHDGGTVYGHLFEDETMLTPRQMAERIADLEKLVHDMLPYMSDGLGAGDIKKRINDVMMGGER